MRQGWQVRPDPLGGPRFAAFIGAAQQLLVVLLVVGDGGQPGQVWVPALGGSAGAPILCRLMLAAGIDEMSRLPSHASCLWQEQHDDQGSS